MNGFQLARPGRRWRPVIALIAIAVTCFPGLALASAPLQAVATVGMVGDVVAQVGGQCVEVTTLMGPGVDPHLYRASAGDLRVLQRAEVVFYAGHSLEGRLGEVLDRFGATRPVVAVSEEAVPPSLLLEAEAPYAVDPHVWMDVSLWTRTVDVVRDALAEIQPACAQEFELRAAAYKEQLAALDRWIQDSVASLPRERRVLVTAHDAFHYYGRAYGLEVVAIQGISTEDEAGLADIRAVTDLVVQRGVPAIFVESSINPRNIEAVQAAAKDRGSPVSIGGELFSDALGHAGTWQGTYIGMLVHNTRAIVEGLGGKPAPWPLELADWVKAWGLEDL